MPSLLGTRNLSSAPSGSDGGLARAKKVADLYIKQHTENGVVTDPNVYDYVNENILAPYADDLSIQQKIAGYENKRDSLLHDNYEQDTTVGQFQQEINDSLFSRGDTMRDPAQMVTFTSIALDNAVLGLDAAIDDYHKNNKSADRLINYRRMINDMATAQRSLVNNMQNGTLPPNLDGFGYFVKTNPVDGSIVGAALLPVNSAPSELTDGMKRIGNTIALGQNASLPVYLPAVKTADGSYQARLYDNYWNGASGDTVLEPDSENRNFGSDVDFDLRDSDTFPIKQNDLGTGGFGRQFAGNVDGQPTYNYFYKGFDNKVYQLDEESLAAMQKDPILNNRLSGYVPLIGSDDVRNFGSVQQVTSQDLTNFSARQSVVDSQAVSARADASLQALNKNPVLKAGAAVQETVGGAVEKVGGFFSGLLNRRNQPNKPNESRQGDRSSYSVPDVVKTGEQFFRNPPSGSTMG